MTSDPCLMAATGDQYERKQELLAENFTKVRGAVRNGPELLAGLLPCGHCDRRIQVRDSAQAAKRYVSSGRFEMRLAA